MRKLLLFASLVCAAPAEAQPLYQGLDAGCSATAILDRFPEAKPDASGAYRVENNPGPGLWTYFILRDGLAAVEIHGRGADSYLELVDALTQKYGKPEREALAADGGEARWEAGGVTIRAVLSSALRIGDGIAREPFTITYSADSSASLTDGL